MAEEPKGLTKEQRRELEELMQAVESGRMDAEIVQKYLDQGTSLLGDESPMLLSHKQRTDLTRVLGRDPGDLRIHTGKRARDATDAMSAKAFAVGERDIFLGGEVSGSLDTREGFAILAHEAMHTIQEQADVGFRRGGAATDELEAQARRVESRVLAEDELTTASTMHEGDRLVGETHDASPPSPTELLNRLSDHDRQRVAERVLAILKSRSRLDADRFGID
ncbi:MAG: hypothetical protein CMH54_01035 [Myxococcales bacterium]|nr:hypothetical protein [Myxococcales bacterium]